MNLEDIRGFLYQLVDEVVEFGYEAADIVQEFLDEVTSDA